MKRILFFLAALTVLAAGTLSAQLHHIEQKRLSATSSWAKVGFSHRVYAINAKYDGVGTDTLWIAANPKDTGTVANLFAYLKTDVQPLLLGIQADTIFVKSSSAAIICRFWGGW